MILHNTKVHFHRNIHRKYVPAMDKTILRSNIACKKENN